MEMLRGLPESEKAAPRGMAISLSVTFKENNLESEAKFRLKIE